MDTARDSPATDHSHWAIRGVGLYSVKWDIMVQWFNVRYNKSYIIFYKIHILALKYNSDIEISVVTGF